VGGGSQEKTRIPPDHRTTVYHGLECGRSIPLVCIARTGWPMYRWSTTMRVTILMIRSLINRPTRTLPYRPAWERAGLADPRRHDVVPWLFF